MTASKDTGAIPPVGTVVLAGDGLGRIVRHRTRGNARGADVQSAEYNAGLYTQFHPDWTIRPAVVGVTVCDQPRGEHVCGLHHAGREDLAHLPRSAASPPAQAVA
ncbi:MAG TPA: hypothetical protein VJT31_26280 [Rugosimonospora sp.]|nr:hypothetical protein [Rugosimonospora sp.]